MSVSREQLGEIYRDYGEPPNNELVAWLRETHDDELGSFLSKYPGDRQTFYVDWLALRRFDADLATDIKSNPEMSELLAWVVEDAIVAVGQDNFDFEEHQIDVRFRDIDEPREITDAIRGDEESELVTVRGQVTKATATKPRITIAAFRCTSCGTVHEVFQPDHGTNVPNNCGVTDCRGSTFELEYDESETEYHQLVRLKEPVEGNSSDQHIDVHLTKDTAGEVNGGERIDTTGTLRAHIEDFEKSPVPDFILEGHSVTKHESDYESINTAAYKDEIQSIASGERGDPYDLLTRSFAHSLKGDEKLDRIKLAIVLQLFGGWRRPHGDGQYARGDIHMALIGDPGTGKSSFLNAAEAISPRSTFTSGKNSTKAGMTAAAVRDDFGDTEWSLESGAIVKAHKGIACVDEIDKVPPDVVSSLHTALEKQRLEVSKAGINATMKCETSLLAAGNPAEGRFIDELDRIQQVDLPPALRSRFDLIFCLEDTPEWDRDHELGEHITELRAESGVAARNNTDVTDSQDVPINRNTMRAYIAYARERCFPVPASDDVKEYIAECYANWRDTGSNSAGLTARLVDAMNRLAEASARVRLSDEITMEDAERAEAIIEQFLTDVDILSDGSINEDAADILDSGSTVSQRDRVRSVSGIIETLQGGTGGVPHEEVLDTAEEAGIERDKAEHEIEKLRQKGSLYEPKTGEYRHV